MRGERFECVAPGGRAAGEPGFDGWPPVSGDADDAAAPAGLVLFALEDSLAAKLAHHQAHRCRPDLKADDQVVDGHRPVEERR